MKRNEEMDPLEALIEHLVSLPPQDSIRVLDPARLSQFRAAERAMDRVAKEAGGKVTVELYENKGWGAITLEANDLVWERGHFFPTELLLAHNFEIYPLKNGRLRMSLMFYGITNDVEEVTK